jgi:osmoprotectant transport system substrate-binding protein
MFSRRHVLASVLLWPVATRLRAAAPVVVSSKLDIEGSLLGEICLLSLGRAGIATRSRLQLGPTVILREALLTGAIDLYPEYTGNGAIFFGLEGNPVWKNAETGYAKVAELDLARNGLVWLDPAPADNGWVIVVPHRFAEEEKLTNLEDLAHFVRSGGRIKLAASAEFVESESGLPAFETTYDFSLTDDQLLVLSGGATSATMKAAADGISGVNAAMAYATDGAIAALDLTVLKDTHHAEPIYAPAPVIRAPVLDTYPEIRGILKPAFAGLDVPTLRQLNEKIALEGRDPKDVAELYLKRQAILN